MPQDNPPLLDKTMNTTEQTSRNLADVLAEELKNIANNVKPDASDIDLAPISGMSANNVQSGISELKGTLINKTALTSTSHTVSGYYSKIGNVVFVSGNYKASSSGTETILLNIPSMGTYTYAVPFRSQTSGALGIIWVTASELRTYNKQGTIAVDDTINFSFSYILNS